MSADNIWEMLGFVLNGLVFVLMGTQLLEIIATLWETEYVISTGQIFLDLLAVSFFFVATRFLWALLFIKDGQLGKIKTALITSLAGSRGAVTLAGVLSLPHFLDNGNAFPERELLIVIATGVIVVSIILSDFVLPAILGSDSLANEPEKDGEALIEILQGVVIGLQKQLTPTNKEAINEVLRDYYSRMVDLEKRQGSNAARREAEWELQQTIWKWEAEHTKELLRRGEIDETAASKYLELLQMFSHCKPGGKLWMSLLQRKVKHLFKKKKDFCSAEMQRLRWENATHTLERLKQREDANDNEAVKKEIAKYEFFSAQFGSRRKESRAEAPQNLSKEVLSQAFNLERLGIQEMFEKGRITWETAREMRNNLTIVELQLED